jgi:hypothetical protein
MFTVKPISTARMGLRRIRVGATTDVMVATPIMRAMRAGVEVHGAHGRTAG